VNSTEKPQAFPSEPVVDTFMPMAEEDRLTWPTHAQVAKTLKLSVATIRRMRVDGRLEAMLVDGVWRFNPDVVADVADSLPVEDDEGGAAAGLLHGSSEVMRASIEMARAGGKHLEGLFGQVTSDRSEHRLAVKDVLDVMRETITGLRERLVAVEAENDRLYKQNREFLDDQRTHDLEVKKAEQMARLREMVFKDFTRVGAPLFFSGLAKKFGLPFDLASAVGTPSNQNGAGSNGHNGATPPDATPLTDEHKAQVGGLFINWAIGLDPSKLESLRAALGDDEMRLVMMVREAVHR
jgi:hypothetical protein